MTAVPGSTAVIHFADGTRVPVTWNSEGRFWQSQALGCTWSPQALGGLDVEVTNIEPPKPPEVELPTYAGAVVQARLHADRPEWVTLHRTTNGKWVTPYGVYISDESRLIDPIPMTLVPTEVVKHLCDQAEGNPGILATLVRTRLGSRL
jgi:hypothetical protein